MALKVFNMNFPGTVLYVFAYAWWAHVNSFQLAYLSIFSSFSVL